MRTSKLLCLIITILIGFSQISFAQDTKEPDEETHEQQTTEEEKTVVLEDIIVTGSRRETLLKNCPQSVTVITSEDIEKSATTSFEELIKRTPGVDFRGSYYAGYHPRNPIAMRGVGPGMGRVLILLDGIPQIDSAQGSARENMIPLENIERIEIIRGPSSALYGSKAMGGVINIITKRPTKPSETSIRASYGDLNTHKVQFLQMGKSGAFGYSISANKFSTDGYIPQEIQQDYMFKRDKEEDILNGKIIWDISEKSSLTFGAKYLREEYGGGVRYNRNTRYTRGAWLDYKKEDPDTFDLRVQVYYDDGVYHGEDSTDAVNFLSLEAERTADYIESGGIISSSVPIADWNILTAGIESRFEKFLADRRWVSSTRRTDTGGRILYFSAFFQDEMYLLKNKLIATFGVRYDQAKGYTGRVSDTDPPPPNTPFSEDYPSKTKDAFCPKLGLVYHLTDQTSFRASIGKAFRFPVITDLYHTTVHPWYRYVGNPDLDPEELVSYDVGVTHWFLPKKLVAKCTVYQSRAKDYIETVVKSLGPPMDITRDNISKVNIWGIETELQYNIGEHWACSVDYTYNRSEIDEYYTNPNLEGEDLAYSPRHKYGVSLSYDNPELVNVNLGMRYFSRSYTPKRKELGKYYTCDLKLSKKLNKYAELSLTMENLFDRTYAVEHSGKTYLQAPGQLVTLGVTVDF